MVCHSVNEMNYFRSCLTDQKKSITEFSVTFQSIGPKISALLQT